MKLKMINYTKLLLTAIRKIQNTAVSWREKEFADARQLVYYIQFIVDFRNDPL